VSHRLFAATIIGVLALALATPADADEAPVLTVRGVVVTLADVEGGDQTVIVAGNEAVSVADEALDGIEPGTRVEAELALPAAVVREFNVARDVSAESELGAAVIDSAEEPLEVVSLEEIPTAAAPAGGIHYLDVAINTKVDDGTTQPTTTQVRAALQEASDYFVENTDGEFPGFYVRNIVRYSSALPCGSGASDFQWAEDAALRFGNDLEYYFERDAEHVVLIGECRHDPKVAVGSLGDGLGSGGFVAVQSDFFVYSDALDYLSGTLAHEFGHNFGLTHANAPRLAGCTVSSVPLNTDITTCGTEPYGDYWSVMGYAVPIEWVPILDVARREQLGLTTPETLATQSGAGVTTYSLNSLATQTGLTGIKVTGTSGTYYVEYRDGTGEPEAYYLRDGACTAEWEPSPTCKLGSGLNPGGPGVRIMRLQGGGETRVSAVRTRPDSVTFAEYGLDPGDSWRTPAGDISVTVNSAGSGVASVTVTTGSSPTAAMANLHFDAPPTLGVPVTAVVDSTTPADAELTYRWFRGTTQISGATGPTYTPVKADAGTVLTVRAQASGPGFVTANAAASAEVSPAKPSLSGKVAVASQVTAVAGAWPEGFTLSYQWLRNGSAISGQTGLTYVPIASDSGDSLSVRVTGTHSTLGTIALTSPATTVSLGVLAVSVPTIKGTAKVGQTLTAVRGTWTPGVTVSYRWYANGVAITGATSYMYKVPASMAGKKLLVKVSGRLAGYYPSVVGSAPVGVPLVGKPTITGLKSINHTLTAKTGTWTTGTSFQYQWYANGVPIAGATKSTFWVTSAYLGKAFSVKVTGTKAGYTTAIATSSRTSAITR
jgi:hypothetical protein